MNTYSTSTSTYPTNNGDFCLHKLPCGICVLTMQQCPKQYHEMEITCSTEYKEITDADS